MARGLRPADPRVRSIPSHAVKGERRLYRFQGVPRNRVCGSDAVRQARSMILPGRAVIAPRRIGRQEGSGDLGKFGRGSVAVGFVVVRIAIRAAISACISMRPVGLKVAVGAEELRVAQARQVGEVEGERGRDMAQLRWMPSRIAACHHRAFSSSGGLLASPWMPMTTHLFPMVPGPHCSHARQQLGPSAAVGRVRMRR